MKSVPLTLTASPQRVGPEFSKKRRRNNNKPNNGIDERIRKLSIRTASTLILVLITSNAIRRSHGFGAPSTIAKRSASRLFLSGRRKRNSSDNYGDDKNNDNKRKEIQDMFAMAEEDFRSKKAPNKRRNRNNNNNNRNQKGGGGFSSSSSLLPPPMNAKNNANNDNDENDDKFSQGLSSWEDFLGGTSSEKSNNPGQRDRSSIPPGRNNRNKKARRSPVERAENVSPKTSSNDKDMLPSIADLFPSNFSTSEPSKISDSLIDNLHPSASPALEGVLPVSDLFYRSTPSEDEGEPSDNEDGDPSKQRDDEELPFSAEQSNDLTSSRNKIKIRRNRAKAKDFSRRNSTAVPKPPASTKKKKLQRRGMEMLVGGVPINADPPQRSVELFYNKNGDWRNVITTNSRDFGPLYYGPSVNKLSTEEAGLYCEYFVNSTLKWNVCPKDLRNILKTGDDLTDDEAETETMISPFETAELEGDVSNTMKEALRSRMVGSLKETFRLASDDSDNKGKPFSVNSNAELSGELVFSIGVSIDELELSGGSESAQSILERVLARGIETSSQCDGFDVSFSKLQLSDLGDGTTTISAGFVISIENNTSMSLGEAKRKSSQINSALARAMDDGDMQLAMAAAAKKERSWSEEFRNRIVEEFLFDDDDGDEPLDDEISRKPEPNIESTIDSLLNDLKEGIKKEGFTKDVPFGMPGSPVYAKDDIFLGGGNDGVFWNYAAGNAPRAPYQGKLGLRMVDAVTEKAKQRQPRVIAIGDVHGCIDELQDLLRECDYRPGDLVVFLGDLVSKGPDSFAVVQMAREIGAIGVRGNHDFEVVRWHQAIKSGVDPPVVGSEHFHIANCLTKADMKWMYSLPWYISSPDLGALFVHAGFVSGIRLAKQNPRLMMNMRSILPDGTVTSKFFNNWPWARLWDGPQTVLFGHDADRGLQQYEHAIGLDTGCVYGGRLTACILPEKRLVSVNARREYFKYRRKHYD